MNPERRHFCRIAFDAPAELAVGTALHTVKVIDLSFKGAMLTLPAPIQLPVGETGLLTVTLAELSTSIHMSADVAHVDGLILGLRCRSIDLDSVTHLRKLIELNLGEPSLLERELKALASH